MPLLHSDYICGQEFKIGTLKEFQGQLQARLPNAATNWIEIWAKCNDGSYSYIH